MSDEGTLRRLAREAIATERVPAGPPKDTWGGNGAGALCDICGLPIAGHEIGFEVEFPREAAPARTYHLHGQCLAAWELERHALEAEQRHGRCNGQIPSPPASEPHSHRLSGPDMAGSMPDCERNVKDGGESS